MQLRKIRKPVALCLMVVILCMVTANTQAAVLNPGGETIAPRWTNTSFIASTLNFSGTKAECSVSIDGYSGTTKISATYELQRKSGTTYTTIKTWTASGTDEYLDWNSKYDVTAGYTYRLYITAKVTRNGTTETATGWVEATLK